MVTLNVLALNAGSSSLKYKLLEMPGETVLAEGKFDTPNGGSMTETARTVIEKCRPFGVDGVGHRVVHGGRYFTEPTQITPDALETLRGLASLDPLHNPTEIAVIEEGLRLLPDAPAVAIFDTAFHRTLPDVAALYALPHKLSERLGLRRFGFHGISYHYVSTTLLQCLHRDAAGSRLIICHLGSGASVCALRNGESVDTSMGFTPLEGLVMGTRSGDVDPGLLLYLLQTQNMAPAQLDDLLNKQSGLKGLGGHDGDVRLLEKAAKNGDERAEIALAAFAYRVRKYIGAYTAVLGGVDAVAFCGGIGEHSAPMRARICENMAFLGIGLDAARNEAAPSTSPTLLSSDSSPVSVWMIPTNEETQVARETFALLSRP